MKLITDTLDFFEKFTQQECRGNYREAARRLGISYTTFYSWMVNKDRLPTLKALESVFARLNVSLTFPNTQLLDYTFIPCGRASLGPDGQLVIQKRPHTPFAMEMNWLTHENVSAEDAVYIEVEDQAMAPLLTPGDFALVDRSDTFLMSNRVYLFSIGPDLMLRRVIRTPKGLTLHADNQEYVDVPIAQEDMPSLTTHGRLRWASRLFA